jgi:hypothetical protein|tara:strand:+ start:577 stop:1326 length:750 start_codon:yes stop_codon:yes gene_type:complete
MTRKKAHLFLVAIIGFLIVMVLGWGIYNYLFTGPIAGDLNHDFGVVMIDRPSTIIEHTFRLKNTTDHDLRIKSATPTCGCTTTQWPEEAVKPNDYFEIPVHLRLKKSEMKKSKIRLEFDSGETAILKIKGVGRFKQSMRVSPPSLPIPKTSLGGAKCVIQLEWDQETRPEQPVVSFPEGVNVEFDSWRFSKASDSNKKAPELWTIRMQVFFDTTVNPDDAFVSVTMPGAPTLKIPLLLEPGPEVGVIGF